MLPDRPVSPHPNLVAEAGLKALEFQLHLAGEAYETAQKIEDVNERRRQAATPLRDVRYFAARVRTAQVIPNPTSTDTVAFGSTVTFRRDDGRVQKYHIVGEDEADPKAERISLMTDKYRSLGVMVVMALKSSLLICCTGARNPSRSRPTVFSAPKETHSGTGRLKFGGLAPLHQRTSWRCQDTTETRIKAIAPAGYRSLSPLRASRSNSHNSTSTGTR